MAATPAPSLEELRSRFEKARTEGRWQSALELIKQLSKTNPSAEHHELLRLATFERGCQLLRDGKPREAVVVFKNALAMNGPPEFQTAIAAKLAEAGDVSTALALTAQAAPNQSTATVLGKAVDSSLLVGLSGRKNLPAELHAGFDAVLSAFEAIEQERDDDARQALQSIALTSPFLEWKLLIRGLGAYFQNDDARALDNWQRLNPERAPWRLSAPFRFAIDPKFRDAQPPTVHERFHRFLDRTSANDIVPLLRALSNELGPWDSEKKSLSAVEHAARIHAALKDSRPQAAEKLQRLIYSAIARHGGVKTVREYLKRFPPLPIDPNAHRLMALYGEGGVGEIAAVEGWLGYLKDIPRMAGQLPDVKLAEALVWERLAKAIDSALQEYEETPPYVPSLEKCYRNSIALVPNRLAPHEQLLAELIDEPSKAKAALAAARNLVERFPDHAPTWLYLAKRFVKDRKPSDAAAAYRAAVKADPMNPEARRMLADILWTQANALANKKTRHPPKPETYRPLLDEAVRLADEGRLARFAMWAVLELRLGHQDAAAEIFDRAAKLPQAAIALPLALFLASSIDKKLPAEIRDRYAAQFAAVRDLPRLPADIVEALEIIVPFDSKALRGKRELVKRLLPKLSDRALERFSEDQLLRLGRALLDLKMRPQAREVAWHGERRFPKNPWFLLLHADVLGERSSGWHLNHRLETARKLAAELPREKQDRVLAKIDELSDKFGLDVEMPGMDSFLGSIFQHMNDEFGEFDDDYDDDY